MSTVKVWDLPVRICHWALAACILANLAVTESGSDIHQIIGYTAVGIVSFRVIWGFIGSRHARFSDFWPTPSRLRAHWQILKNRQPDPHPGHNPFGALMMLALWGIIIGLGITGYMMGTDMFWGDEMIEELHETLANSLIPLIVLHVAAALLMSYIGKINLVRAMITGNKNLPD
ncbi:cytochrome B561 [Neisseria arctica]|uniref:Cytochrome B561 n=1 Tax=Neisseria arctica TaxID=1470200 RepID=A0A0J0YTC7_9NEIS|nr:cytochrome b/b6 domain-containing protein [Neisseria arctica]KLT73351.1 cytochrome B561 [Neisseria arctica]UOO87383.1 cytochrome b/b6 domain-containing protein [Neisseria arctica]